MSYVIGGGLAGLIWAYFNPEFKIIAGSNFLDKRKTWYPMPQYIYSHKISKKFLKNVTGKNVKERTIKVGIWENGDFVESSPRIRQEYWEKTRGEDSGHYKDYSMSMGKTSFRVLDYPFRQLECDLAEILKDQLILEDAVSINFPNKYFMTENPVRETIEYNRLIVTIPQPVFWEMVQGQRWRSVLFRSKPITVTLAKVRHDWVWNNDFHYVLFPQKGIPFYRMTKGHYPCVSLESTNSYCKFPPEKDVSMILSNTEFSLDKSWIIKHGKIVGTSNDVPSYFPRIGFFGRYGTWNPLTKVHLMLIELWKEGIAK